MIVNVKVSILEEFERGTKAAGGTVPEKAVVTISKLIRCRTGSQYRPVRRDVAVPIL